MLTENSQCSISIRGKTRFFSGQLTRAGLDLFLANLLKEQLIEKMTASHSFPSIYFGLLHDIDGWNAYDDIDRPRNQ